MEIAKIRYVVAIIGALSLALAARPTHATEPGEGIQYPPGAGVGGVPGLASPPGFATFFGGTYNSTSSTNGVGTKGLPEVTNYATFAGLLYNPQLKLLGADYYASVILAVLDVTLDFGGGVANRTTGLVSPGIKPIGLSWALPNNLFFEAGLTTYIPIGQYDDRSAVVTGDNYWTFQPDFGLTYLANGWNISGKLLYDFNTVNTTTNYQSGQLLTTELTVGRTFGKWTVGGGGYYWTQTTRDHNGGVPAGSLDAAVVGNGVNPNGVDVGVGPYVSYSLGPIVISGRILWDVYTRNTTTAGIGQGSHATLGFFLPL
jgi:hypothetical protein